MRPTEELLPVLMMSRVRAGGVRTTTGRGRAGWRGGTVVGTGATSGAATAAGTGADCSPSPSSSTGAAPSWACRRHQSQTLMANVLFIFLTAVSDAPRHQCLRRIPQSFHYNDKKFEAAEAAEWMWLLGNQTKLSDEELRQRLVLTWRQEDSFQTATQATSANIKIGKSKKKI